MSHSNLTQITSVVIKDNAVQNIHMSNGSVTTRHYEDNSITEGKLAFGLSANTAAFLANDFGTWSNAKANIDVVNANAGALHNNLTSLISGTLPFASDNKIFLHDVTIRGNLSVEGAQISANVANLIVEDTTIAVNWNGSSATAEGAGLVIVGTGNALLANFIYATSSQSNFRVGTGTLTALDDVIKRFDLDVTFNKLDANINVVSANADTKLNIAGGNLTGFVNVHANPTTANNIASKSYVDGLIGTGRIPVVNNTVSSQDENLYNLGIDSSVPDSNYISVWADGIYQPQDEWQYNSGNNTIQFFEANFAPGVTVSTLTFETV